MIARFSRMRRRPSALFLVLNVFLMPVCAGATGVGVRNLPVAGADPVVATLWYQTAANAPVAVIGGSSVFIGTPAVPEAPIDQGRFPLILVSFGGLRAAPGLGNWIAADLAAHGHLVAVVEPPSGHALLAAAAGLGQRPARLSAALTAVAADPALAAHLRPDAVGALGWFLGGSAALALAGARLDPAAYAASCDHPAAGRDCAWFARQGVDLHSLAPQVIGADHHDPRVTAVVAVAPELGGSFDRASLGRITVPVTLIALGAGEAATITRLAARLPVAQAVTVAAGSPFDGFPLCTEQGPSILQAEDGGEAPCAETPAIPRAEVHQQLAWRIAAAFAKIWDVPSAP